MDLKQIGEMLLTCVDMPKLKKVVAFAVVVPMLEKFVADTSNPYDDKAVVFFKEWAEKNI